MSISVDKFVDGDRINLINFTSLMQNFDNNLSHVNCVSYGILSLHRYLHRSSDLGESRAIQRSSHEGQGRERTALRTGIALPPLPRPRHHLRRRRLQPLPPLRRAPPPQLHPPIITVKRPPESQLRIDKKTFTIPETLTIDAGAYLTLEQTLNPGAVVSFKWICLKNETEINANNLQHYTTGAADQCFSDEELIPRISSKGPLFHTSVRHFRFRFLPQSYFLYVIVDVGNDTATHYVIVDVVMVTIVMGDRPVVTIACIGTNCDEHLNPLLPLALTADCSNCDPSEVLSYVWSVQPATNNNTILDFNWLTGSVSGNKNRQIILKIGAFIDVDKNETYILTVIVIREDGSHGMAIRPLKVSDVAVLRLSMRAVNHKVVADDSQHSNGLDHGSLTAIYVCVGIASLSVVVVGGAVIAYRKLSSATRSSRIRPLLSTQQPEVKQQRTTPEEGATTDPHQTPSTVDVTTAAAASQSTTHRQQSRPSTSAAAATTTSSQMSSASMTIIPADDNESLQSRRSL